MAHTEPIPVETARAIAKQVGQKLELAVGGAPRAALGAPGRPELGESLSVWMLGLDAVTRSDEDINRLATQTGRWHHQIRYGGKAQAFARSVPVGPRPEDWSVIQVFESELAKEIDEAIDWVDQNVQGDPAVRLLLIPAYQTTAFWLIEPAKSQLLVVSMPDRYTRLAYRTLYSPKDFLTKLSQERHVQGLPRQ